MERLEAKRINGKVYYYYSKWQRVQTANGNRCRRVWQKYLGNLNTIVNTIENGGPKPRYAEVFQWGLTKALWDECHKTDIIQQINSICSKKRNQGISTGEYMTIAAINRAISPASKNQCGNGFQKQPLCVLCLMLKKTILHHKDFGIIWI